MEITAAGRSSLWWDMQSCPLPPPVNPFIVTSMASALLHKFNIIDVNGAGDGCRSLNDYHFSAYAFFSPAETELYQTLINSGIRLLQLPPGQRYEMEKMMIADILFWAMDTPPPANLIFIVGSVDFCYIFQKLWQRSYNIFLVCPSASQIRKGMLNSANDCLEWLPFLGLLQDEDHQSHSPRGNSVFDHTFSTAFPAASVSVYETVTFSTAFPASSTSNHDTEGFPAPCPVSSTSVHDNESFSAAFPASSTSVHDRHMEESNNASVLKYSRETLLRLKPTLSGGWDGTCGLPFDLTASSTSNHDTEAFPAPSPVSSTSVHDNESFSAAFPASSTSVHDRQMEESNNASVLKYSRESLLSLKPTLSGGWDGTCGLPFDLTGSSPAQTEPGFHGHFIRTEKPRSPVSSASSTEKNKSASLEEFKAWLNRVVNGNKHAEKGYSIGPIHTDFWKATGMILDEKLLGFSDIRQLVEECKDIAVLKEVKRGCHLAFAVKPNEQQNPMFASKGQHPKPVKKIKSKEKPKTETDSTRKPKASAEEFREFICHLLQEGEFSQGFLMSQLRQRFEQHTGKFLDVEHLGYKKMTALVASYSHLVSVGGAGPGPIRIFPSGFVSDPVPNLYPNSNTIEETPISRLCDPSNLKAKIEAERPSSGGSGKESFKNFNEQLPYMNYENEWLPSMTTGSRTSANFSPFREANSPTFLEFTTIKSDSSSGPGGSQVRENEGQSSKAMIDTTLFHGELAECNFIKQHDSILQRESNNPIEEISVNAETLMAETMQNMRLKKEMTSFCRELSIHGDTVGIPDSIPPMSKSPGPELQAGYNSSLVDSLQSGSRAESSAFCGEDLRHGIQLDCKQNEQSTSVEGYEERSLTSAVSSRESIVQIAARVLSSICEPTKWRKNS